MIRTEPTNNLYSLRIETNGMKFYALSICINLLQSIRGRNTQHGQHFLVVKQISFSPPGVLNVTSNINLFLINHWKNPDLETSLFSVCTW